MTGGYAEITSIGQLTAVLGEPNERAATKVRDRLHELDRQWLARSPFCLLATAAPDGTCDVSPKGDPDGFTVVLDDRTIAIPDRPGNRRGDGFRNLLRNPHVGLLYLVPGRSDTLRINGRTRLLSDAPFFDDLTVQGHRPELAIVVEIEEVFYHCAKAFLRAQLWEPQSWHPDGLASVAEIAKTMYAGPATLSELERWYDPVAYAARLYQPTT